MNDATIFQQPKERKTQLDMLSAGGIYRVVMERRIWMGHFISELLSIDVKLESEESVSRLQFKNGVMLEVRRATGIGFFRQP